MTIEECYNHCFEESCSHLENPEEFLSCVDVSCGACREELNAYVSDIYDIDLDRFGDTVISCGESAFSPKEFVNCIANSYPELVELLGPSFQEGLQEELPLVLHAEILYTILITILPIIGEALLAEVPEFASDSVKSFWEERIYL